MPKFTKEDMINDLKPVVEEAFRFILIPEFAGTGTGSVARYRYTVYAICKERSYNITVNLGKLLGYRVSFRNNLPASFITTDANSDIMVGMAKHFDVKGKGYEALGNSIRTTMGVVDIESLKPKY